MDAKQAIKVLQGFIDNSKFDWNDDDEAVVLNAFEEAIGALRYVEGIEKTMEVRYERRKRKGLL